MMTDKKASELLLDSAMSFDAGCLKVLQLEKDFERCLEYLDFLGIDPMEGGPEAERIVAMTIQQLQNDLGIARAETNDAVKELYELKRVIGELFSRKSSPKLKGLTATVLPCDNHYLVEKKYGNDLLYKCSVCNHIQGVKP